MTPEAAVGAVLAALDAERRAGAVVVAVSGGSDSMALLHATVLAAPRARAVRAVTVDHGLRPEAAEEAQDVARACAELGVPHAILRWDGPTRGNLQDQAREARRRLIGAWARGLGAAAVLLGHTADDQAETVLLRLARGSGVDGLAGMPAHFEAEGAVWDRPLLAISRASLRNWLSERSVRWIEDPSNEDPRFDRARARAMAETLAGLGLTRDRLLRTAGHMARARVSLAARARDVAKGCVTQEGRDLLLPPDLFHILDEDDTAGRVLAAALQWVGGRAHRPRWDALRRLALLLRSGKGATLAGCRIVPEGDRVRITPEARNLAAPRRDPRLRFAESADFR